MFEGPLRYIVFLIVAVIVIRLILRYTYSRKSEMMGNDPSKDMDQFNPAMLDDAAQMAGFSDPAGKADRGDKNGMDF